MSESKHSELNARFSGTWKLTKNEHMDPMLKVMGVPWPVRKIILTQKPTLRLEVTDSSFRFVEQRKDLVDHTYDFGGKCEEVGPDGLQKLVQVEWEGEALVRTDFRRDDGAYHSKTVYALSGEELVVTFEFSGLTAHRHYRRLAA